MFGKVLISIFVVLYASSAMENPSKAKDVRLKCLEIPSPFIAGFQYPVESPTSLAELVDGNEDASDDPGITEEKVPDEVSNRGCGCHPEPPRPPCHHRTKTVTVTVTATQVGTVFLTYYIESTTTLSTTIAFTQSVPGPTETLTTSTTSTATISATVLTTSSLTVLTTTVSTSTTTQSTSTTFTLTLF